MNSDAWWRRLVEVGLDIAVVTGVLYLFGLSRTNATLWTLGIHPSLVQLPMTEYVLRGINIAVPLLTVGVVLVLICFVLHRRFVVPAIAAPRYRRPRMIVERLLKVTATIGVGGLVLAGLGMLAHDTLTGFWEYALPLGATLGAAAILYAYTTLNSSNVWRDHGPWPVRMVILLLLLGVVWSGTAYAEETGEDSARNFASDLSLQPEVIIFSQSRLAIAGRGVEVKVIGRGDERYRYCYRGLRLFIRSNDQYVLMPVGWRWGDDALFLVPLADNLRVDMRYGGAVSAVASC
ncbi:MAG: hypothetical protein M3422_10485 [Actinomycetota bacterium]|nr:hypothetical protein [Actinomycetota bacterium]